MLRVADLTSAVFLIALVSSQSNDKIQINILFINDASNVVARRAVEVALSYVQENPDFRISLNMSYVEGNRTDSRAFLTSICAQYDEYIAAGQYPHIVLDTTITGLSSETVKTFTAALALPTVSASFGQTRDLRQWRDLDEQKNAYLLQVMTPADIVPEVIRSIVTYMNITNAAILYDDSFVMDHKYKALLQNIPTRHVITAMAPVPDQAKQIEKLRNLDINNFFVLGTLSSISGILEAAKPEFFERNFGWHAITLETGSDQQRLSCRSCAHANVMFVRPQINQNVSDRAQLIRERFNLTIEPQISAMFYFDLAVKSILAIRTLIENGTWLPPSQNENYITCDQYDDSNAPVRSVDLRSAFVGVTEPTASSGAWHIAANSTSFNGNSYMKFYLEVRSVRIINGDVNVSQSRYGTWLSGLNNPINVTDTKSMIGLSAAVIYRVATFVQPPFVIRDPSSPKGYKGYCIDLLNEISKILHFDYEIKESPEGFGRMNDDGEWNGVVRRLIDKQADIGLGSMSVMAERETVIDFTVPYYDLVGITIMMLLPSTPSSLFKFLTVLETNVWLCILAAYFFTSFLMWVFDRWSPYSYQNNREKYKDDDEKREFNIKECLWFCMTSLTPQGGGEAPKNLSGRLVAATWWLFGFIIIASYTANLAAFLTVSRLDVPIESLDGLAKQYKILYAPLNNSNAMIYFKRMSDIEGRFYEIWKDMSLNDSLTPVERSKLAVWDYPVSDKYTKMWQAIQEAGMPSTITEALDRVRNSTSTTGFAFIGDATDIRYLVMTHCDLQIVGEELSRKPYAIAVQQGSPLKEQFNNALLLLLNKRELEKLKEDWWNGDEYQSKCEKAEDQSNGISIQNIGGVFIVIFVGIGMACVILVCEFWYYKLFRPMAKVADAVVTEVTSVDVGAAAGGDGFMHRKKIIGSESRRIAEASILPQTKLNRVGGGERKLRSRVSQLQQF